MSSLTSLSAVAAPKAKPTKSHLTIFSDNQFEPPATNFGNLPLKVLGNIFSHLTEHELTKTVSPVCQKWRYAALQPELWKNLKVVGDKMPARKIGDKIWMCPKLESVYLRQIPEAPQILRQIGKNLAFLVRLTVRYCDFKEEHLRYVIFNCKKLRCLDLKGCNFAAQQFFEELSSLEDLTSVNLSNNACLTKANVYSAVVNCKNLEEFHLSVFSPLDTASMLRDEDLQFILSTLGNLRRISLDAVYLTNVSFQLLLDLPQLDYLGFYGALHISGDVFRRLGYKLNNLQALKIRQTYEINPEDFQSVFENGPYEHLEELDLTGSKVDDQTLYTIAYNCPNLRSLILRSCKKFTDLSLVMQQCPNLDTLNIAFCDRLELNFIVPHQLETLFIDKNAQDWAMKLKSELVNLRLKLCLSEYNKLVENI